MKICIVVPSLKTGGMERVASTLANQLAADKTVEVHLVTLSKRKSNFTLNDGVIFHQPPYQTAGLHFLVASFKSLIYLRSKFKQIKPFTIISFGDRYNSLSIFSSLLLESKVFVSNRQNPHVKNGFFIDSLNFFFYRFSDGIVAQTDYAKNLFVRKYNHSNVKVIPNPIKQVQNNTEKRELFILNVGRFDDEKRQFDLIRFFDSINNEAWRLLFVGEGHKISKTKRFLYESVLKAQIEIHSFTKDIHKYYASAAIFAFTSRSEGFPNALAEAMAAGCACIAYDCIAGPSDIIDDGINGFLIPAGDEKLYKEKLQLLMNDSALRERFGKAAKEKMKQFEAGKIAERFYRFITVGVGG